MDENPDAKRCDCGLVWFLRISGAVGILAIVPAVMPLSCIAAIHEWLGLGTFPDQPIAEYLARSTSMFYAFIGVFAILLSFDTKRFSPVITCLGLSIMICGALLAGIDYFAGMPRWWAFSEGPLTILMGLVILALQRISAPKSWR